MRLLLDTHIALWQVFESARLPAAAIDLMLDPANTLFVSAVSIWEIAIKHRLVRNGAPAIAVSGRKALKEFEFAGLQILGIKASHAAAVDSLPHHHGDPFDRLLIAQALDEPLRLVTADRALAAYGEIVIPV